MTHFVISLFAALGVVIIIIVLGLILTQIFITRADIAQTNTNIQSDLLQGIIVDIDQIPETQQEPGITVISNDIIDGIAHHHYHIKKKTVSVIDQNIQINHKDPTRPIKTDNTIISSNISIVNPLIDKITLEY
ncbi:unnamed protein product [Adineta steineri]|uniref:Uncharacterized protein n=1 Tax=Adineta steineri TaxID=433720 RepID=A0A815DDJ3_9BILA|nr:unnamed protein product [Adineta steineri]CAF1573132.1 unnamed protein product [Adineta steineri]